MRRFMVLAVRGRREFGLSSGCFQWPCYGVVAVVAVAVGQRSSSFHPTIAHQSLANPSKGVMVGQSGLFLLVGRVQTLVTSPRPRDRINMAAGNTKSRCHCLSSPTEHQHQQPSIFSSNAHSNIHPKFKWRRDRSSTQGQQSRKLSRPIRAAT